MISPEQKGPETAEHQRFSGFQSVGKDEVGSSNLPSSSKIPLKSVDFGGIFYCLRTFEAS